MKSIVHNYQGLFGLCQHTRYNYGKKKENNFCNLTIFSNSFQKTKRKGLLKAFGNMKVVMLPLQKWNHFTSPHTTHSPCGLAPLH